MQLVNATDTFISFLITLNTENSKRLLNLLDFQDENVKFDERFVKSPLHLHWRHFIQYLKCLYHSIV